MDQERNKLVRMQNILDDIHELEALLKNPYSTVEDGKDFWLCMTDLDDIIPGKEPHLKPLIPRSRTTRNHIFEEIKLCLPQIGVAVIKRLKEEYNSLVEELARY